MSRRVTLPVAVFAALLLGAALALGPQQRTLGTSGTYQISFYPGGSSFLTCGWHDECLGTYAWAPALDWNAANFDPFSWISQSSNNAGSNAAASGNIFYTAPACHITYVDLYDLGGSYRAEAQYVHTTSSQSGQYFWIWSSFYSTATSRSLGTIVGENPSVCPWLNYILDTGSTEIYTYNTYYPTRQTCDYGVINTDCGTKAITTQWQTYWQWIY